MHVDHGKSHFTDDKMAWSLSRDLCNVWKINANISKTVQENPIVTIKFE